MTGRHDRKRPALLGARSARSRLARRAGTALLGLALLAGGCGSGRAEETARTATEARPPPAVRQTGRLGTPESLGGVPVPFAHQEFRVTNMWLGHRGRYSIDVYAGYPPYAPRQGQLRVTWIDNTVGTPDEKRSGTFVPPGHVGRLRITAVRGDVVAFAYRRGRGTFSLRTHRFHLTPDPSR